MSDDSVDELINQLETLRVEQDSLIQRLVVARARETQTRNETNNKGDTEVKIFTVGCRVRILNRVKVAHGKAVSNNDKRAIITRVTATRIYFRTVNGNETWRSRSNLRIVENDAIW